MTVAEVQAMVGVPSIRSVERQFRVADVTVTYWRDRFCELAGWWWVLTRGVELVESGWSSGSEADRDRELGGALLRELVRAASPGSVAA